MVWIKKKKTPHTTFLHWQPRCISRQNSHHVFHIRQKRKGGRVPTLLTFSHEQETQQTCELNKGKRMKERKYNKETQSNLHKAKSPDSSLPPHESAMKSQRKCRYQHKELVQEKGEGKHEQTSVIRRYTRVPPRNSNQIRHIHGHLVNLRGVVLFNVAQDPDIVILDKVKWPLPSARTGRCARSDECRAPGCWAGRNLSPTTPAARRCRGPRRPWRWAPGCSRCGTPS